MRYAWKKQENDLWSCENLAIFAQTKKNGKEFGPDWMMEQCEDARKEQANDVFQPFHIGHSNKEGKFEDESACGRYGNHRLGSVRCGPGKKLGILVDGFDIPEKVKVKLESGELMGRSVEVRNGKLRSTALLGKSPPHNRLAHSSEPVQFEEVAGGGQTITFAECEDFMLAPPAAPAQPAAPAPAPAPAQPAADPMAAVKPLLMQLCQALGLQVGGPPAAAPAPHAAPAPAAPAPESKPPASRFEEDENQPEVETPEAHKVFSEEIKQRELRIAELEAQLADTTETSEVDAEAAQLDAFLAELREGSRQFDEKTVRAGVKTMGLETYRDTVAVHFRQAPTSRSTSPAVSGVKPTAAPATTAVTQFKEDPAFIEIQKKAGGTLFSEAQLQAGIAAAKEWDDAEADGVQLTTFGREYYVQHQMKNAPTSEVKE